MPHLALLLAVTFWASSPTAIKIVLAAVPVIEAVTLRFVIAAIMLWLAAAAVHQAVNVRRVGWRPFVAGMIEPGLVSIIAYQGLLWTTAVHAALIFALMPLIASVFARVFLKEAISVPVIVGALVGLGGIILLVSGAGADSDASLAGDLLIILALFMICGVQLTFRRLAQEHGQPALVTAMMMSGATVTGAIALATFGDLPPLAWSAQAGIGLWSWFLYTAVAVSGASFFLQNYALRHLPVGRVTLYSVLSAPIGVPFAWLVLGESISTRDLIAIAIVVTGVALPALTRAGFRGSTRP